MPDESARECDVHGRLPEVEVTMAAVATNMHFRTLLYAMPKEMATNERSKGMFSKISYCYSSFCVGKHYFYSRW